MKFNKILTVLSGAALLCGAYACTDEVEYNPAPAVTGDEVFFSNAESADVSIALDATSVSVNLHRVKTEGELAVGLTSSITDVNGVAIANLFSVPTEVVFPDGVDVVPVEIGVVFGDIVPETDYMLTLSINGENTTPYGLATRTFTLCYAPWTDWEPYSKSEPGALTINSNIWNGTLNDTVFYHKSLVNDNLEQFMMYDWLTDRSEEEGAFDFTVTVDKTNVIEVDGDQCYIVTVNYINTGYDSGTENGTVMVTDYLTWYQEVVYAGEGYTLAQMIQMFKNNNLNFSYYNPKTGLFSLDLIWWGSNMEVGYAWNHSYSYLQLPGFKSYYVEFNTNGNYVDKTGMEYVVVSAIRSEDVASYAYTIKQGALTEEQVKAAAEELAADTDAELVYDVTTTLTFALEEEGDYTIVAVGYDESGAMVCTSSYTFTFESVMKESDWNKVGIGEYTDGYFYGLFTAVAKAYTMEVQIEEHKDIPGYYRVVNPYETWPYNKPDQLPFEAGNWYLYVNASDPTAVYIESSAIGLMDEGDMTYVSSLAYLDMVLGGATLAQVKAEGETGTLVDGVVTFPARVMFLTFGEDNLATGRGYFGYDSGSFALAIPEANTRVAQRKSIAENVVASMSGDYSKTTEMKSAIKGSRKSAKISRETINKYFMAHPQKFAR